MAVSAAVSAAVDVLWERAGPGWHRDELKTYARHLSGRIHKYALPHVTRLQSLRAQCLAGRRDLFDYMGARGEDHALYAPDMPWLSLFETQICKAFAIFIKATAKHGSARAVAFLRALAPRFPWPDVVDEGSLEVELEIDCSGPRSPRGNVPRIDLMITFKSAGQKYGAVLEVKTRRQPVSNPLGRYTAFAESKELRLEKYDQVGANAIFVILVPEVTARLRRRVAHHLNRHWQLMEWHVLLRRLERILPHDDEQFRQFRKIVWKAVDV